MSRAAPAPGSTRNVLRLAWPAVLSYVLNNAYRLNDQFWAQGLGGDAQAALGAMFFCLIMNFALLFLAAGGTLALVAQSTGAANPAQRGRVTRHALVLAFGIGAALTIVGPLITPTVVGFLGLEGEVRAFAEEYLSTLYLVVLPMALVPALDNVFIGRGDTRTPMVLLLLAVALNYVLNPLLIYGSDAASYVPDAPGVATLASLAAALGIEGQGLAGAAYATGLSRTVTGVLGLLLLRFRDGEALFGSRRVRWARLAEILRISAPVSLSIAAYAGVYWLLFGLVISKLDPAVAGGLGIGFTVFEGISFPCYLGVSIAAATLVGQRLGARDPAGALEVVRSARRVALALGATMTLAFLFVAPHVAPLFTEDSDVLRETLGYVFVLAFSQLGVALETVNEKVLLGAGYTRPIVLVSSAGNALRIPLAWLLAIQLGGAGAGVWWAINVTTYLKAAGFAWVVRDGAWLRAGSSTADSATPTPAADPESGPAHPRSRT